MKNVLITINQIHQKNILRYSGYEFYFTMSVVSTTNTRKILKGAALAGNLSIFKEYARFGGKKTSQYVCMSPNIEIFNYYTKYFELSGYCYVGACLTNNYTLVKKLDSLDYFTIRAFKLVCKKCNLKSIKKIFRSSLRKYDISDGLAAACSRQDLGIVKFLIEKGAVNIDKISDVIVKKENYLVLDYMIKRKFDENFVLSIIDRSIERKNINMIDYCIQKKYIGYLSLKNIIIQHRSKMLLKHYF